MAFSNASFASSGAAFEDLGHVPHDCRGVAFEQRQRREDRGITAAAGHNDLCTKGLSLENGNDSGEGIVALALSFGAASPGNLGCRSVIAANARLRHPRVVVGYYRSKREE